MPDKETTDILTEADHVRGMLGTEGWKIVKAKLDAKILDLQNIHNLDMTKIETLPAQLAARTMAVSTIWAWLKNDVIGFVEQQESNTAKMNEKIESFIEREL